MKFVDAHHHLWQLDVLPYPWLRPDAGPRPFGDHAAIKHDYRPADYAADMQDGAGAGPNIAGSVHVQANAGAADPVQETQWVWRETRNLSWPVAIVAEIGLDDEAPGETIARHAAVPTFRGVRIFAGYDDDPAWRQCSDPRLLHSDGIHRLCAALARTGHSLDLVVHAGQLADVARLAAAFPELAIVINHLGQPRTADFAAAGLWRDGIDAAAAAPNVRIKLSGLWTVDREWRPGLLAPFVGHAVSAFGVGRCMYGSNLPIEKVMLPPQYQIPRLLAALPGLTDAEKDAILRTTAARFYRL